MMKTRFLFVCAAFTLALGGCGGTAANEAANAAGNEAAAVPEASNEAAAAGGNAAQPAASPAEEQAVMTAAGFRRSGDEWRDPDCSNAYGDLAEMRDLNGDGRREAVIRADGDQCYGHNNHVVLIYTQEGARWRQIADLQHRFIGYTFRPRQGLAWPDVEIFDGMLASGDEPLGCVPFYRHNGREYVHAGTSDNGRICELEAEAPRAPGEAPASGGLPPLGAAAGHYVAEGTPCGQAIEAIFYDGRRLGYLIEGVSGADAVRPLGRVTRRGPWFVIADQGIAIRVLSPTRIQAEIQDTTPPMRICPPGQLPASLRVR
jgi:hypothetical protein